MLNVGTTQTDNSFFFWIIFSLLLGVILWKTILQSIFRTSTIPSPKGSFITGNFLELKNAKDGLTVLEDWTKQHGPILRYRPLGLFGRELILVADPEAAKQILVTNSHKYDRSGLVKRLLPSAGNGLFTSIGKAHSRQKMIIGPAFYIENLKGMVDVFRKKAGLLIKVWSDAVSNDGNKEGKLFVHKDLSRLTLDVIGECAFGYQVNSLSDENNTIALTFANLLQGLHLKSNPLRFIPILNNIPTKAKRKENIAIHLIDDIITKVIEEKLSRVKNQQDCSDIKRKDLIDLCIKMYVDEYGEKVNMKELRSQVFTFMLAGHETTGASMSWTLYYLAQYPEIQEKVRHEIKEILKDGDLTWDTFESMEYLTAVIKESLRLRPPAPTYERAVFKEDNILGHKVPQGSIIVLSPYLIHRLPGYWKDPDTFNPDRFLLPGREEMPSHRFAFLPFSNGPRMCIGHRFAMQEMKVVLSMLLQNFAFSLVPGISFSGGVTITYKPKPSLQLLVRNLELDFN